MDTDGDRSVRGRGNILRKRPALSFAVGCFVDRRLEPILLFVARLPCGNELVPLTSIELIGFVLTSHIDGERNF